MRAVDPLGYDFQLAQGRAVRSLGTPTIAGSKLSGKKLSEAGGSSREFPTIHLIYLIEKWKVLRIVPLWCYVWVCSYQHHTIAISWQSLSAAFTQRREPGLPSLLAGSHKLVTHTWSTGKVNLHLPELLRSEAQNTGFHSILYMGTEAVPQAVRLHNIGRKWGGRKIILRCPFIVFKWGGAREYF